MTCCTRAILWRPLWLSQLHRAGLGLCSGPPGVNARSFCGSVVEPFSGHRPAVADLPSLPGFLPSTSPKASVASPGFSGEDPVLVGESWI